MSTQGPQDARRAFMQLWNEKWVLRTAEITDMHSIQYARGHIAIIEEVAWQAYLAGREDGRRQLCDEWEKHIGPD